MLITMLIMTEWRHFFESDRKAQSGASPMGWNTSQCIYLMIFFFFKRMDARRRRSGGGVGAGITTETFFFFFLKKVEELKKNNHYLPDELKTTDC